MSAITITQRGKRFQISADIEHFAALYGLVLLAKGARSYVCPSPSDDKRDTVVAAFAATAAKIKASAHNSHPAA